MRKFFTLALVGALALGVSSVAYANFCAFDPVPAATLLFPFVAFDYNNPVSGTTTLFAITNTSSEAQVVHITIWTDYSDPVLDYNIVLSGYDIVTQNIRDILYFGDLPNTGTSGDLLVSGDDPFADGPVNEIVYTFPFLDPPEGTNALANASNRCRSSDPYYPDYPPIPQGTLDQLRAFLQLSQSGTKLHDDCAGTTADCGGSADRPAKDPPNNRAADRSKRCAASHWAARIPAGEVVCISLAYGGVGAIGGLGHADGRRHKGRCSRYEHHRFELSHFAFFVLSKKKPQVGLRILARAMRILIRNYRTGHNEAVNPGRFQGARGRSSWELPAPSLRRQRNESATVSPLSTNLSDVRNMTLPVDGVGASGMKTPHRSSPI